MDIRQRFGCAIFDDPTSPSNGWFALDHPESEDAQSKLPTGIRTETQTELRSGRFETPQWLEAAYPACHWLTNITYNTRVAYGMPDELSCYQADYLHQDIGRLADRYGITDARDTATFGAAMISRVLATCETMNAGKNTGTFDLTDSPERSLKLTLKNKLKIKDVWLSAELATALRQATYYNMNCSLRGRKFPRKHQVASFLLPPQTHCKTILATKLPKGKLEEVPQSALPPKTCSRKALAQYLKDTRNVFLCRILWHSMDDSARPLLRYVQGDRTVPHELWLTRPDLELLQPWTEIIVLKAYAAAGETTLRKALNLAASLPRASDLSLSMTLLLENLWHACTAKTPRRRKLVSREEDNPITPFLHAQDRKHLFETARSLHARGIPVQGFANGRIRVDTRGLDPMVLYQSARDLGCIPPLLHLNPKCLEQVDSKDPLAIAQYLHATGNVPSLLKIDRRIVANYLARNKKTGDIA